MKGSADIRRDNRKRIYRLLMDGKAYTKQQVAMATGLSVATSNTLLNDMCERGIVIGESQHTGEVGRNSVLYWINDSHECYLACFIRMEENQRVIETTVFSALGRILCREKASFHSLNLEKIQMHFQSILGEYRGIVRILVAPPGIVEDGIIRYSDIPELESTALRELLESWFALPVIVENDMHCMAYGYSKRMNLANDVVTLAYYASHVFPGTATIHKGMMICGSNGIAGMAGFLPYGVSREDQLRLLAPQTCIPYVAKSLSAIMVLLNPGIIVLSGDLIHEEMLRDVRRICAADIPMEYMPDFVIADNLDEYLYAGLFEMAVNSKVI